jgi:hypothetical protein
MGITLERGRFVTPQDNETASVVIDIDDAFVHIYLRLMANQLFVRVRGTRSVDSRPGRNRVDVGCTGSCYRPARRARAG